MTESGYRPAYQDAMATAYINLTTLIILVMLGSLKKSQVSRRSLTVSDLGLVSGVRLAR